jgi:DNA polymerase III subunit epsilon
MKLPLRDALAISRALRTAPIATARFVAMDLETTGPRMLEDRIISIGAIAVRQRRVVHAEAFEATVRQPRASETENILIHQIGGQEQLAGSEPPVALRGFLEFLSGSIAVAFRAEFDATVLEREVRAHLGRHPRARFLDLACLLPGLFQGSGSASLDDWLEYFVLPPIARHHAVADAYANAQLLLLVLERARQSGLETIGDLLTLQRAQRWLGRRH